MNNLETKRLDFDKDESDKRNRLRCLELAMSGKIIQREDGVKEILDNAKKMFEFVLNGTV